MSHRSLYILIGVIFLSACQPMTTTSTPNSFSPTIAVVTVAPSPTFAHRETVYYVATNGDNAQTGTLEQPWLTIQKCLDQAQPGDTCEILGGVYNEALVLKTSGTESARITLKKHANEAVTVNSGSKKTIVSGGRVSYYTIDGLRLIANFTPADQSDVSIDLGKGVSFSRTDKTSGNHGFIVRNCYIEGAIHFYGHANLLENCEINGKNIYQNAVIDDYATSYDNVYRSNTIYAFVVRGIWSKEATHNILIEGNIIHDIQHGIDCDGAAVPVTNCQVIGNHIYNVGISEWGSGIFLENCFECVVENNTIHEIQNGAGIYVINYGNGDSTGWQTFNQVEYRDRNSNTSIVGNLIYNYNHNAGLYVTSVNGLKIDHNTFYTLSAPPAISFHAEQDLAGVIYLPLEETITNNIFYGNDVKWFSPSVGLISEGNFVGDPGFFNPPVDFRLPATSPACTAGVGATYAGAFPCQ